MSGNLLQLVAAGWTDADNDRAELRYRFGYVDPVTGLRVPVTPTATRVPVASAEAPHLRQFVTAEEVRAARGLRGGGGGARGRPEALEGAEGARPRVVDSAARAIRIRFDRLWRFGCAADIACVMAVVCG